MLKHTFVHIPGIGLKTESRLWALGIRSLAEFTEPYPAGLAAGKIELINYYKEKYEEDRDNPRHYADLLTSSQHWRLFSGFRQRTAYLDIETTGLDRHESKVTTIALYDGNSIYTYVNGENLEKFADDISNYEVIITYNGKCFDLPFLEEKLAISFDQVHIDLRYLLSNLGFSGGLKGCERQLGICRGELDGVDGYGAVLLWEEYVRNHNRRALETLLAYNIQDTVNLENLMVQVYNLHVKETPFACSHAMQLPEQPEIPFLPDKKLVEKIRNIIKGRGLY